ncbi:MAG TPA: MFS transporter [Streptosporangiaceae bacterium]|nr:MFS transporter [Streptosporangiaceae bacterium]
MSRFVPGPRRGLPLAVILQALISAGDGLAMVGLASRVYQSSHASWAVALVFLAITVPITALAPAAGVLLDRCPVRPVLVTAAAAQTLVALALTRFTGTGATLGLSVGFGLCAAVLVPGLGAIVPRLAGESGVTRANGYLQAATWGGFTAGPLLAGVLTAAGGTGLALGAVAAVYGTGALGLAVLRLSPVPAAGPELATSGGAAADGRRGTRQFSAGLRFLRADREAGLLVLVVSVMVMFGNMASVAEVAFAEGVLRSGPAGYSLLVAAWTAGMLAGTLAGGRLPRRRLALVTLLGSLAAGAGVALAAGAVTLWQAAAAYGIGGVANGAEVVATRSFLNHRAPPAISGRVFAMYSGLLFGAASLGMAVAGGLLAPLNPRLVLLIAGAGGIVAGALGWLRYSRLARPGSAAAPGPVPGGAVPDGAVPDEPVPDGAMPGEPVPDELARAARATSAGT